jgi:hypothetical protein
VVTMWLARSWDRMSLWGYRDFSRGFASFNSSPRVSSVTLPTSSVVVFLRHTTQSLCFLSSVAAQLPFSRYPLHISTAFYFFLPHTFSLLSSVNRFSSCLYGGSGSMCNSLSALHYHLRFIVRLHANSHGNVWAVHGLQTFVGFCLIILTQHASSLCVG